MAKKNIFGEKDTFTFQDKPSLTARVGKGILKLIAASAFTLTVAYSVDAYLENKDADPEAETPQELKRRPVTNQHNLG